MRKNLRIGTRESRLALAQTEEIKRRLESKFPSVGFEVVKVKTLGDEFQTADLFKRNKQGVFTRAIERRLLSGEVDIAVHSLKDLPTRQPKGLRLAAFTKRLDPCDVLVSRRRLSLGSLPRGAVVGTGSPRRKRQLLLARPDLEVRDVRGNLDTRVKKVLIQKKFDAVLVARAGLLRLRKYLRYARRVSPSVILPAAGQASLALEARGDDKAMLKMLKTLNHDGTEKEVLAERNLLRILRGGCRVPVGVYSKVRGKRFFMKAAVFSVRTDDFVSAEIRGPASEFMALSAELGARLLAKGAGKLLKEARA